jgi:hypothetical protein
VNVINRDKLADAFMSMKRAMAGEHFTRRNPAKAAARLANRIRNVGYHVEIRAAA